MQTAFRTSYERLFSLSILHHYFLNKGNQKYVNMSAAEQEEALEQFDLRSELALVPVPSTRELMQRYRMLCKPTARGIEVLVECKAANEPRIPVRSDLELMFALVPKNRDWIELSDLPVEGIPRVTLTGGSTPEPAYYLFSNRTAGSSSELSQNGLAASLTDRLDQFPTPTPLQMPAGAVAGVRMEMTGNSTATSLLQTNGQLRSPAFTLSFQTRNTVWRFLENNNWLESTSPLPLSVGVIRQITVTDGAGQSTRELPNPSRGSHKQDPGDPSQLISEIYL